jgi:hypothetical protein
VCFANVEADWCYIVVSRVVVGVLDWKVDGNVELPGPAVALQAELPYVGVPVKEVVPQLTLSGIDLDWYPEVVILVVWNFHVPLDSVFGEMVDAEAPVSVTSVSRSLRSLWVVGGASVA